MSSHFTIKDQKHETRVFKRRFIIAMLLVIAFTVALMIRLFHLQVSEHRFYATQSRHNLLYIIPSEPTRGLIYDRNGILLAKNIPVFSLDIIPADVKNIDATIRNLKPIVKITPDDIKLFHRSLNQHRRYDPVPLKVRLNELEIARFYVNQYRFPGVIIQTRMVRAYPLGPTVGNVVGYVGRINTKELSQVNHENYTASDDIGKVGIEKYYENQLHGTIGAEQAEINASGKIVRSFKSIPPIAGKNLYLTIDSKLQAYAEKTLGNNSGAIIAIQPSTGQVLAMVTHPTYDPNLFVNGISNQQYQQLLKAPQHPLYDRAIRGLYSPGSTIKPSFAIAGLNDNVITPKYRIFDPGWFRIPNTQHIFHDWKYDGHGWVNVSKAIMVSCDTFFYNLATKLGIKRMDQAMDLFGFGQPTGIDMPDELGGVVPTPYWKRATKGQSWYTGDSVNMDIGQGMLLVTPLQLAQDTAIIAEHGLRFRPHLLLKTEDANGNITQIKPITEPQVTLNNQDDWNIVTKAMINVIDNPMGTAVAFGPHHGYLVAGKTGTAQVYGKERDEERSRMNIPKRLRNNHTFIAFAPVKNPQIAIAVVVEHASFADRIAGEITRFYMNELKPPQKSPVQGSQPNHG